MEVHIVLSVHSSIPILQVENGLVRSWNQTKNNELSHSLCCVYFSNLDKSLYCFEYKNAFVNEKLVHSKIFIGQRILFTVQLILFQKTFIVSTTRLLNIFRGM